MNQDDTVEATKSIIVDIIEGITGHWIDDHTASEREQELLRNFSENIQDAIESLKIIGEGDEL